METISKMNDELHYTDEGNGEKALIFLHYFGGSSRTWKDVIEILKDSFRCIAVDLPGFGASFLNEAASLEDSVAGIEKLLQKLALKSYVLIGHSMGGKMALALAAKKPEGLQRLILIAPSPPTPEPADVKKQDLLQAFGDKGALEKSAKGLTAHPLTDAQLQDIIDDNLRISRDAWEGWINYGSQQDISSQMKNIEVPVTVISGDADPNFSTGFLKKEFGRWFAGIKFIQVVEAGHLIPIEQPQAVATIIQNEIKIQDHGI